MFYLPTVSSIILNSLIYCHLLSLKHCEEIDKNNFWNRINQVSSYATRKPIPWGKITVPHLLSADSDNESNDLETFKTFVYILVAVCFAVVFYYCLKCCKCMRACTVIINGTAYNPGRTRNANGQNSRLVSLNRSNRSRIARRLRRPRHHYQRVLPETHNSRTDRASQCSQNPSGSSMEKSQSLDKPPDYSTVISGDLKGNRGRFPEVHSPSIHETPPPSYDENLFK